jgi:hypothetical protein
MRKIRQGFRKGILMGWIPCLIFLFFVPNTNAEWVSIGVPEVSGDWGLTKGRILSSGDGWVIGNDFANQQGVFLQFKNSSWKAIDAPKVSSNWELNGIGFTATNDAWAVGVDFSGGSRTGVLLHYTNGLWTIVTPPFVSLDWGLYDVSFTASNQGWAVGVDYSNQRGILLRYNSGIWASFIPPDVSLDWGLSGMHMINANEGWAVGVDHTNQRGVLLQYTKDPDDKNRKRRNIWQLFLPPQIDGDWELSNIFATSTTEAWAVGVNRTQKRGMMLHFYSPRWDEVIPPAASSDWEFADARFPSAITGWVSGIDYANQKGIVLQYDRGVWTNWTLPVVSSNWDLGDIWIANTDKVWAFGTDHTNKRGVILRYSAATANETVSTPSEPNGPTHIGPNVLSTFYTGESLSILDHSIQYFFDWGDASVSGWLPVGTVGASKSWSAPGTYQVKAKARCDTDTSEESKWSSALSVTVSDTPTPITLVSPPDGTAYTGCSLYSLPTFTWNGSGSFTNYEIQFSKTESFDRAAASDKTSSTSILMDDAVWKKVLSVFGTSGAGGVSASASMGGPVFWRVIGTRSDKVEVISGTLSIFIEPLQPVGNPTITDTSKESLPVLSWENACNIKFKVWFGNNAFFSKKTSLAYNIKDPNANGGVSTKTLTSSQWTTIQNLVGKISGSTIYWYVESWDGVNRRTITQPNGVFVVTE